MRRRAALLPLLVLAHAGVALALFDGKVPRPVPSATAITVVEVAASAVPPAAPILVEVAVPAGVDAPAFETLEARPALAAPGGDDCAVAEAVGSALRNSPATPAALAAIPADVRTVANALMLWDGSWTALPPQRGGTGVARLREIVAAAVRAAPPGCLAAPLIGPRLVFVPDRNAVVALAFGSGTWSWSQLVA